MLHIKSAQYGDTDRAVERSRERGVEDSSRSRYLQGDEKWEIWGVTADQHSYRASDDSYMSPEDAKADTLRRIGEYRKDFVALWVSQADTGGSYYEGIWEADALL